MQRVALGFAVAAVVAATLATPAHMVALGLATAAIGTGWIGYRRRTAPGMARLAAAAAIAIGAVGLVIAILRVVLVLIAIDHLGDVLAPIAT